MDDNWCIVVVLVMIWTFLFQYPCSKFMLLMIHSHLLLTRKPFKCKRKKKMIMHVMGKLISKCSGYFHPRIIIVPIIPFHYDSYLNRRNEITFEQKMKFEWARLESYKHAPYIISVSFTKLAKEGFFYTGEGTKCKCAFCGLVHGNWSETDEPRDIHRHFRPHCPLLRETTMTNNVPIHREANPIQSDAFSLRNSTSPAICHHGIVSRSQQTNHRTGQGDLCRSFYCGIGHVGLHTCEENDNPVVEHIRHFIGRSTRANVSMTNKGNLLTVASCSIRAKLVISGVRETPLREGERCHVCNVQTTEMLFIPCGHRVTCRECSRPLTHCIICKATIDGKIQTFIV